MGLRWALLGFVGVYAGFKWGLLGFVQDVERAAKSDASATPLHVAAEEGQLDAVGLH